MKKLILMFAAFVMVASGVAAVSAYEAHIINVKAKVENALLVSGGEGDEWDLGTIFPQEFFTTHYTVSLSGSFLEQKWQDPETELIPGRVNAVAIALYAEEKVKTPGNPDIYYPWMGEMMKLGTALTDTHGSGAVKGDDPVAGADGKINFADDGWELVGPMPGVPADPHPRVKSVLVNRILGIQTDGLDQIDRFELWIGVDAPVFLPFYNYDTDVYPKPNGLDVPTWEVPVLDGRNNGGLGSEVGIDIKIQVTSIYLEPLQ